MGGYAVGGLEEHEARKVLEETRVLFNTSCSD